MNLTLMAGGSREPGKSLFLAVVISFTCLGIALAAIPQLLKYTKPYYTEDGSPRPTSEICSNPRCQGELDRRECLECGRLPDPFKPVIVALFVSVGVPAALNGTCLVGAIGSPDHHAQYVSAVSYLVAAAILIASSIAAIRREKKS